jgi:hypothetical protein
VPVISIGEAQRSSNRDGRDRPGHDGVDVIPGGRRPGRGSTIRRSAMDSLRPLTLQPRRTPDEEPS